MNAKIKTVSQLKGILKKKKRRKIVFTNGCFDIIHYGHVQYLQKAKTKGDILIVGLNSDASVKRLKGEKRPINCQKDRAEILSEFKSVDFVVIFNEDTPLNLIKTIKPDILVKGADWRNKTIVGSDIVKKYGGKTVTISYLKNRSTSGIIKRISS